MAQAGCSQSTIKRQRERDREKGGSEGKQSKDYETGVTERQTDILPLGATEIIPLHPPRASPSLVA